MSRENFDQHLRQMFDGFTPDVPLGKFESVQSELDNLDVQSELVRQTQVARRLAIGATVVAIGALGWTAVRLLEVPEQVALGTKVGVVEEMVMAQPDRSESTRAEGDWGTAEYDRKQETAIARTTTSVHIEDELEPDASASNDANAVPETTTGQAEMGIGGGANASDEIINETEATVALDDAEERDALAGLASSVQEACEGTEVSFTLGKGDFDGSVLWNFGDGNFSNEARPTHVFESPGTYDITISLRSRDNGMIRTKTVENMIVVRPKPDAELNWTATMDPNGDGLLVKYVDETVGSSSSTWLVDGHGLERGEQHFHRSGQHAVHLVASNAYGCQDSQERIVEVGGRHEAKAPGLFSPNGDGRYDVFLPGIVSEVYGDWKLEIFDEKGQVVFETSDETRPWDGVLNAGRKASPGAEFKWILSVYHKHSLPTFFFDTVRIER
jgi:gliding motility-associated-like protein